MSGLITVSGKTDVFNPEATKKVLHLVASQTCLKSSRIICLSHRTYTIEASFRLKIRLKFQCQVFMGSDDDRERVLQGRDPETARVTAGDKVRPRTF